MTLRHFIPQTTLTEALRIVRDPSPDDSLLLRRLAWAALKGARGQGMRQTRLNGGAS